MAPKKKLTPGASSKAKKGAAAPKSATATSNRSNKKSDGGAGEVESAAAANEASAPGVRRAAGCGKDMYKDKANDTETGKGEENETEQDNGKENMQGKQAPGKRKTRDEESREEGKAGSEREASEAVAAAAAAFSGHNAEDEQPQVEEMPAKQPLKRLRGVTKKKAVVEDSDDEIFGAGAAAGSDEKVKVSFTAEDVMDLEGLDDDERESKVASKGARMNSRRPMKAVTKVVKKKAEEEEEMDGGEQDTAGEEEDMEEAEEAEGEDDESEVEEVEGAGSTLPKAGNTTVTDALMAGTKRAKSAPPPKKKVKGSTAASIVVAKTEDLLAKASWKKGEPVPFEAIAEVFNRVEQTTKRLEIQEILRGFLCTVIALTPEDLTPCVYLACNQLAPAYEGVELGIGDMVLQKALQGATGRSAKDIKTAAQKAGDLGEVAQHSTKAQGTLSFGQRIKSLSARDVLERYRAIAAVKGGLSGEDKINRIKKMLVSCKGLQAKYIVRGLQGKMRIGLTATTVMVSLAHAALTCPPEAVVAAETAEKLLAEQKEREEEREEEEKKNDKKVEEKEQARNVDDAAAPAGGEERSAKGEDAANGSDGDGRTLPPAVDVDGLIPIAVKLRDTPESHSEQRLELAVQLVKQAYSECPNLDLLIKAILAAPLYRLQQTCRLTPGVPVFPMLAKPTKSILEVLQRLSGQEFTCEYKYDGMRAQVHRLPDGTLRFFSRSSKDSSGELPDVIPVMEDCVAEGVSSYVIDTEVVAYDRDTGNLLPFQMLSTRGRKDVDAKDVKVKVIVEAFDMLYLNGKSMLQMPLLERRKVLRSTFKEIDGRFRFATFMDHKEDGDTGPIEEFLAEAVKGNCEGLMVKTLTTNSTYEPSKRSLNWLKLKKDYLQADGGGVGDSLDLVPIGAFFGKGKRTGKYGAYLLACYEPDREEYQSVCKIGTGFTDGILQSFWDELKEHTVENRPRYYNVADSLSPDVWLAPHKVWEVKCADLSKSPVHKAAIGKIAQEPDRGISIRFPRLLRERDDKDPEQATTSDQILDMYESQDVVKSNAAGAQANNADDEDDWEL